MDLFEYRDGDLCCEDVRLSDLADETGTPAYVYSAGTLLRHYRAIADAFAPLDPTICFSVKSLANVHVLKLLASAGSGFDVVSGGEIARVLAAGGEMSRVVFAGVGKNDSEIEFAIASGVGMFNVESAAEFENLSRLASLGGKKVHAALRINPDVYDPATHRYTTTGKKETKFGVDIDRAGRFFETYGRDPHVELDGIHLHIGSPIYSPQPYVQAVTKAMDLAETLCEKGFQVRSLNLGGGYAADYDQGASPRAETYAEALVPLLKDKNLRVLLEPGRQISCNAGVLLTRVLYVKQGGGKKFLIVDAAMTDLLRPALYEAEHFVYPARLPDGASPPERRIAFASEGGEKVDIVGGVCETSDFLATDRVLPPMRRGDLLAVFSAGAYGFVMSSHYNSRPNAAEVLVQGDSWRVIRRRENYDDLFAAELDV